MKYLYAFVCLLALLAACGPDGSVPGEATAEGQGEPESLLDRASYSIGFNMGKSLSDQDIEADLDLVLQGVTDGFEQSDPALSIEDMQEALTEFQEVVQARQLERAEQAGVANQEEAEAFLAENKNADGVETTPSGLQYLVITEGSGPNPGPTANVTVHYTGTLLDGTKFDSSRDRGQPATFGLNQVIAGWTEGLQLMSAGATYKFFIPSNLAYGERGSQPNIGPHAALIFDVELISIGE